MKIMKTVLSLFFLSVVLGIAACTQSEKEEAAKPGTKTEDKAVTGEQPQTQQGDKKLLARVDGVPIYQEDLQGRGLKGAIRDEILYQEGLRQGLDKKYAKDLENYKKRLIVESLKRDMFESIAKQQPSDQEVEELYNKNRDKYTYLSLTELSTGDKNTAEEIRDKLVKGANPTQIASDYSQAGVNVKPTNLRLVKKYNDLFEKKEPGQVSKIVEEGDQFKIFVITDAKSIPLLKAKNAIQHNLMATKRGQVVQEMVEKIKKENNVKIEVLAGDQESSEVEAD
jgi:hypothetical protein